MHPARRYDARPNARADLRAHVVDCQCKVVGSARAHCLLLVQHAQSEVHPFRDGTEGWWGSWRWWLGDRRIHREGMPRNGLAGASEVRRGDAAPNCAPWIARLDYIGRAGSLLENLPVVLARESVDECRAAAPCSGRASQCCPGLDVGARALVGVASAPGRLSRVIFPANEGLNLRRLDIHGEAVYIGVAGRSVRDDSDELGRRARDDGATAVALTNTRRPACDQPDGVRGVGGDR